MRRAVVLLLAVLASSCAWNQMEGSPPAALRAEHPVKVRVTTRDGRELVLRNPVVHGDSILGASGAAVDTANVTKLEGWRGVTNGTRVALGVAGVAALATIWVLEH